MKTYSEIAADGGSGVVKQILKQQGEIDARLSGIRHIVAVGSGKGGVGKSSIAVQLALSFFGAGRRVALLDVDFNGPSVARLSGVRDAILVPGRSGLLPPKTKDGITVLSLGSCVPENECLKFESVSQGHTHTWRQTREFSALAGLLAGTEWGELDALIIDLPPGPERTMQFMDFFGARLNLLLVSLPSDLSAGVVLRTLRATQHLPGRILGYLENMQGYLDPESNLLRPLFPDSAQVNIACTKLGSLPFEPALASLCDTGMSFNQWSKIQIASLFKPIAEKIWLELESGAEHSTGVNQ